MQDLFFTIQEFRRGSFPTHTFGHSFSAPLHYQMLSHTRSTSGSHLAFRKCRLVLFITMDQYFVIVHNSSMHTFRSAR